MTNKNPVSKSTADLTVGMTIKEYSSGLLQLDHRFNSRLDLSWQLVYFATPGEFFARKCASGSKVMRNLLKSLRASVDAFKSTQIMPGARHKMLESKFVAASVHISEHQDIHSNRTRLFLQTNADDYERETAVLVATPCAGGSYDIYGTLCGNSFFSTLKASERDISSFASFISDVAFMQWQSAMAHTQGTRKKSISLNDLINHMKVFVDQPDSDFFLHGVCEGLVTSLIPLAHDASAEDVHWFIARVRTMLARNDFRNASGTKSLVSDIEMTRYNTSISEPTKTRPTMKI